MSNFDSNFEL
jgi:dynein heavy chain